MKLSPWLSALTLGTTFAQDVSNIDDKPDIEENCTTTHCKEEAMAFAFSYGYPLYSFGDMVKPIPENMSFPNTLIHNFEPSTPGSVGVVRPNADTIYSMLFLDLSSRNLELTVPEFPDDKYWVFPLYTPYGDNLVNLGYLDGSKPGKYLIEYSDAEYGVDMKNPPEGYVGLVRFPMVYGSTVLRIVTDRTEEDVEEIQELQRGFSIETVDRDGPSVAPRLNLTMFRSPEYNPGEDTSFYEAIMKVTAQLAHILPPYVKSDRSWVADYLMKAGVDDESYTQPKGTNLTGAVAMANASAVEFGLIPGVSQPVANDWSIGSNLIQGVYHSLYTGRYFVAANGYLALTADQALYPNHDNGTFQVEEGKAILFTFTEPPKLKDGGFWSLTAYGPDQDLIENEQGIYTIGDRSNLTFPDGEPIGSREEGEFQILLQDAEIEPPSNWTSNWLPVTPGSAEISATLRWYGAGEYMSNGSYVHPKVEFIDVITGE